ncbi:MAG: M20/M25/M40 family metallo-hydrolase, partial [Clostridia bacterium]|nr:M20/M25/M40 family metallo-hydrolase [Clostridia bacterium]
MKKRTKVILGTAAGLTAANLVHAALYRPKKVDLGERTQENVNEERMIANVSKAIQFRTVSNADEMKTDWDEFDRFHAFLDEAYPLIAQKLEKEVIGRANLMYRWKGKYPALEPIALLGHQDVVPVSPGTEGDWEHPPYEGFNDGEYIWGRGAMDMKNHLIGVMEAVETLLEE